MEALITPSAPTPSPELSCLPRFLEGSHTSCAPTDISALLAALGVLPIAPLGLWWLSLPQWGLQGADVAHGEGFGLRGAALSTAAPIAPGSSSTEPPNLQFCETKENANIEEKASLPHSALCWIQHCVTWEGSAQLQSIPVSCTSLSGVCVAPNSRV